MLLLTTMKAGDGKVLAWWSSRVSSVTCSCRPTIWCSIRQVAGRTWRSTGARPPRPRPAPAAPRRPRPAPTAPRRPRPAPTAPRRPRPAPTPSSPASSVRAPCLCTSSLNTRNVVREKWTSYPQTDMSSITN